MAKNPRVIRRTKIFGGFMIPIGLRFLNESSTIKMAEISTVCLDNGYLEDPLRVLGPEYGYETLIFLDGCSLFSVYERRYETLEQAQQGHANTVKTLIDGTLPLTIKLRYYVVSNQDPVEILD